MAGLEKVNRTELRTKFHQLSSLYDVKDETYPKFIRVFLTTIQTKRGCRVNLSCINGTAFSKSNATAVGAFQRRAATIPCDDDIEALIGKLLATDVAVVLAVVNDLVNICSDLSARREDIVAILSSICKTWYTEQILMEYLRRCRRKHPRNEHKLRVCSFQVPLEHCSWEEGH